MAMLRSLAVGLSWLVVVCAGACAGPQSGVGLTTPRTADPTQAPSITVLVSPTASGTPLPTASPVSAAALVNQNDMNKLNDHLVALTSVVSRYVLQPCHANALGR